MNMPPSSTERKTRPRLAPPADNSTDTAVRLAQVEVQLVYLTDSIKTLSNQIEKTETIRGNSLLEYVQQHGKVVADATDANKKVDALRVEFDASETDTDSAFEVLEARIDDWEKKIGPLLTAHKILVWVAIFFASSIGLLLWGILTHTIAITYMK